MMNTLLQCGLATLVMLAIGAGAFVVVCVFDARELRRAARRAA